MLDSLFSLVLGIAVLMTILTAFDRDEIAWPILAFLSWITCAITVSNLERPYVLVLSDDSIQEYIFTYQGGAHMIWFFLGIAIVFIAIFYHSITDAYREWTKAKGGGG